MVSLEQVKLLETKVARAIEHVDRVNAENAALLKKESEWRVKLDAYQKRVDELEVLVMRFKEDQSRIEDGILSALDRLSQFEDAIDKSLKEKQTAAKGAAKSPAAKTPAREQEAPPPKESPAAAKPVTSKPAAAKQPAPAEMFFEIPEGEIEKDIADPLAGEDDDSRSADGELDIF
ncbi:MAG: cell division protein ZapB [Treponema sp.]|nr:cell division protein ZapB [Treponema sp.]